KGLEDIDFYAGNFIELIAENSDLMLVTTPSNKLEAEHFLASVSKAEQYFDTWINEPSTHLQQILYIPTEQMTYVYLLGARYLKNETYVNAVSMHNNLDQHAEISVISANLFADEYLGANPDEKSAIYGIRQAF